MDLQLMSILFSSEVKNAGFIGLQMVFDPKSNNAIAMVEAPGGDFDGLAKAIGASISTGTGKGDFDMIFDLFTRVVLEGAKGRPDRMLKIASIMKETYDF